jgi:excinuclease UvrABC nuclease subunit
MGWTDWLEVADVSEYNSDNIPEWEGPACYELGVGKPRGRSIEIMYVGETNCLRKRIASYARDGSHLEYYIDDELNSGKILHYRFQRKASKEDATILQNNLLEKYDYPWNYQRNCD